MGLLTFKGGIHPNDGKDISKHRAIVKVQPKGDLVFLLSQHIGAPAKPIVAVGDHVKRGQMIAEAGGFVSSPVHASVSGTVKSIESRMNVTGAYGDAIVIESDDREECVAYQPVGHLSDLTKEQILARIRDGGVVGMGGAGFPTHVKMSPKEPDKIEYIIVNGAECEPYLTSDYRRMLEEPEQLVGGLKAMLQLFDGAKGYIAIEDNKPDCIELLTKMVADEGRIQVRTLKTKYPQGAERMLISACTGRKINSAMLPADAGCIVDNVDTVCAIYRAVMLGEPLMERIVTVTGDAVNNPGNFLVHTGTIYKDLVEEAGGFRRQPRKMISGGPMMGFGLYDLNVPVTKTSSALTFFTADEVWDAKETHCINCGRCVSGCPEHLIPSRLADFANAYRKADFEKLNGLECCECGCCSFVCPAKRPLTQSIKSMRRIILADKRNKKA